MAQLLVVCGGRSLEREISLKSGRRAAEALRKLGHAVELADADRRFIERIKDEPPDAVFVALHGGGGEDGTIQDLMDLLEVPYTGSGPLASALCMDKHVFKTFCAVQDIPTPRWHSFTRSSLADLGAGSTFDTLTTELGLPLVVKPAREGSSLGIHFVDRPDHLTEAVIGAMSYDDRVIVERYVEGRELAVTLLGPADAPRALPIIEIETDEPYYTFTAHYEIGASTMKEAELEPAVHDAVLDTAKRAYATARCRDFARVDVRLEPHGPQVLEINTIPGLTETGPTPLAADVAGWTFEQLIAAVSERALDGR
jgi:D-alanine-D-alanine ligase